MSRGSAEFGVTIRETYRYDYTQIQNQSYPHHLKEEFGAVECKIDSLPDELLVNILSYLSVKKATTTYLASSIWRYL
ncbi:hypothetical protein RND71_028332 [Anisodus tanguticus]|uniref:F-box domain-containing protein n=1 Tax=Anisodus tanguticus TaxID=243964 RepID=A0AAE1RI88_9SOLA|nr:hypothetical protein RND71_028332 [Anisodus tanguticus]